MKVELVISILSLVVSIVIGLWQIKLAKDQKVNKKSIESIETKFNQSGRGNSMSGIINNSNNGDISNNNL